MPAQEGIQQNDEHTPLLRKRAHPTPLPTGQLFALSLLMIAEPLNGLSIVPYINELVSQLPVTGGDEKKVGYYAGIILSLYFVGEAVTILQWSRLSDFIGRKPVLLRGTLGLVVTTLMFGLSRSFWALAASRFLAGALNGNVGVMKCMLAEMSDETNVSRAIAIGPLSWTIGAALGPYMGGLLSRPQDHWPNVFSHSFWTRYPYFLPCAAASAYSFISLIIGSVVLKETLHKTPPKLSDQRDEPNFVRSTDVEHNDERLNGSIDVQGDQQEPPPSTLFTRPVLLTVANYGAFSFLETGNWMILPLVYTASIQLGGLGLDPALMGICMAVWGILRGVFQLTSFHRILNFLGLRRTLIILISGLVPSFLLFPINGTRAQSAGTDTVLLVLVLIQLICSIGASMAYSCIFIYVSSAAPKGMLGATNGLAQTVVSVQRAIAPAITASLFSFSLEKNIMGGYGVFYAFSLCSLGAIWLASRLPPGGW